MTVLVLSRRDSLLATLALGTSAVVGAVGGCGAIYPELGTRTEPVPPGLVLDPPPPDGLRWVSFESAEVPPTTRDGRPWGRMKEGLPDVVARLFVNDVELIKTDPAPKTVTPRFTGKHGNFPVKLGDAVRVELWDSDPLNDRGIGTQSSRVGEGMLTDGRWRATFDMGGSVTLLIEKARAIWGLGLWYELRSGGASITRMLDFSPAQRAALRKGDVIVKIGPTEVAEMTADEVRSAMNAPPPEGLAVTVRHEDGSTLNAKIKPGPIYPTFAQYGAIG